MNGYNGFKKNLITKKIKIGEFMTEKDIYLDKTNIDRESYLYILIILGIPLITVCYISDIIFDKIENTWIK